MTPGLRPGTLKEQKPDAQARSGRSKKGPMNEPEAEQKQNTKSKKTHSTKLKKGKIEKKKKHLSPPQKRHHKKTPKRKKLHPQIGGAFIALRSGGIKGRHEKEPPRFHPRNGGGVGAGRGDPDGRLARGGDPRRLTP
jgi:hypothetical protein